MFLLIAAIGVILFVVALVFDDALDGLVPDVDWLSLPALAAAMVAFGATAHILDQQTDIPIGIAVGVGGVLAIASGIGAVRLGRAALDMATDATPTEDDLLGTPGRVVTPIVPSSLGEVVVQLAGQPVKLAAVADGDAMLPSGTEIVVVAVLSPTRVRVQDAAAFWGEAD